MKNTYWMILAAGMMCFAACHTEQDFLESEQGQEAEMRTEVITATVADDATKATVDGVGTFGWVDGTDMIAVHTTTGYVTSTAADATGASASFSVTYPYSSTRDAYAIFPSYLVTPSAANYGQAGHTLDVTLPSTYTLEQVSGTATPCPMIATNTPGAGWTFSQLCGLLRLTVNDIPEGTSYLKLDFNGRQVSGGFSIASPYSTIASVDGTKGEDDFITITGITDETSSVTVNIPLPTGEPYADLVVSAWSSGNVALKAAVEHFTYEAANAKGKKFTSTLNKEIFTVGSGKYAVFSPSNLVATIGDDLASTTWTFHEHQYDMVYLTYDSKKPFDEANQKTNYQSFATDQKIDLFGWVGTSSAFTGKAMYGITDITVNAQYGSSAEALKDDWGNLSISGYAAGTWYTPSSGKWMWLIGPDPRGADPSSANPGTNCRESSTVNGVENARFAKMMVNGVVGLMVFPDNYVHPEGVDAINHINSHATRWDDNTNVYNELDWNKMEQAGAVFLPSAMTRSSKDGHADYIDWGRTGYYWTSTPNFGAAMCVRFSDGYVQPDLKNDRSQGKNVRLVRDLN